jgi:hypothetical protein
MCRPLCDRSVFLQVFGGVVRLILYGNGERNQSKIGGF